MSQRTNVYVDGFNLYYGCLRHSYFKWLDLGLLFQKLLPTNDLVHIRYFTAPIVPRPRDPQQGVRQQTYLRALRTLPHLSVIEGRFLVTYPRMMKADLSGAVAVIKTEEKGSDVNIASHILTDAFDDQYDVAVLVSNDSDL